MLSRNNKKNAVDKGPKALPATAHATEANNTTGHQELEGKQMPAELDNRIPVEIDDNRL